MEIVKGPSNSWEDTLARLVAQYEVALLRTCYMYLRDRGLAEDATQETFLKAYRALPDFRGACSEKTWLMRIAVNTCRDMQRNAWFRYVDRRVEVDQPQQRAAQDDHDQTDALAEAILRLPIKCREVILLHFYQDMTFKEIAGVLHIAVSTVGKRIKTACSRLERMLGKEDDHESSGHA